MWYLHILKKTSSKRNTRTQIESGQANFTIKVMTSSETVPKTTNTSISVCSTKIKKTDTCFNSEEYVKKMEVKIGSTNRQPTTKKKNKQSTIHAKLHPQQMKRRNFTI